VTGEERTEAAEGAAREWPSMEPPNRIEVTVTQPTEWVRWPCPVAGCDIVAVGRTVEDARKALYLDHTKAAHDA
jgi:hypothetical protein